MNIDWSKAPEGATHWDTGLHGRTPGWMRLDGTTWYWWPADGAKCERKWFVCCETYPSETKEFVARPITWTGEGLPPVGTVCEIRAHKLNGWSPATIKFASRNVIVWDWEAEPALNGLCTAYAHAIEIRPIRTAEQIAEEARITELNLMVGAIKDYPGGRHGVDHLTQLRIHEEACIDLYDAGWRKPVTP